MENPGSELEDFHKRHQPLYDVELMETAVAHINTTINGAGFYFRWDKGYEDSYTSYRSLPDDTLMILSGFDFSYYYNLEIGFHGVVHHDLEDGDPWPDHWSKDQIVLFPQLETERYMQSLSLVSDPAINLFGFNIGSHSANTFYILAKGLSYHFGTVFFYDRLAQEVLKENERVAYWARPQGIVGT